MAIWARKSAAKMSAGLRAEDGEGERRLLTAGKSGVTGSEGRSRPLVLPPGGGTPGVASPVPSGGAPPARVLSFCPATTASGRGGGVTLVRALSGSAREVKGGAPAVAAQGFCNGAKAPDAAGELGGAIA